MKIIFAVDKNSFTNPDHAGVNIKVASQIEQMRSRGHEVTLQQYEWVNGQLGMHVEEDTDVLYFRRIDSSVKLIKTLKACKKKSPKLRIMMEIPTFPYKGEEGRLPLKKMINNILGDMMLRSVLDRIVICGADHSIESFKGVKVVHFSNGVDFDKIPLGADRKAGEDIHMICVSGCMLSHGYDRMIEGLHKYYEKGEDRRKVYFHIVGTGDCYGQYEELAKKYNIKDDYVYFHGRKVGSELDEIYAGCNLGIAHLALHRIGLKSISSLKSVEYAARGIPIVSCAPFDTYNDQTKDYMYFVPMDESPVDIEGIIEYFDKVYSNENVPKKMRDAFYEMCDWSKAYQPVLEYIG